MILTLPRAFSAARLAASSGRHKNVMSEEFIAWVRAFSSFRSSLSSVMRLISLRLSSLSKIFIPVVPDEPSINTLTICFLLRGSAFIRLYYKVVVKSSNKFRNNYTLYSLLVKGLCAFFQFLFIVYEMYTIFFTKEGFYLCINFYNLSVCETNKFEKVI